MKTAFITHRDFWDTNYLKSELTAHRVSEGKSFCYFLAITGFDWLQFTATRLSSIPEPIKSWQQADALSTLLLTVLGLIFLFWCNGGVRGKDFLYRYFPLSFVVGWKFMVLASVMLWLCALLMKNMPIFMVGWTSTTLLGMFNIAMFLRIGFHLRQLASCVLRSE